MQMPLLFGTLLHCIGSRIDLWKAFDFRHSWCCQQMFESLHAGAAASSVQLPEPAPLQWHSKQERFSSAVREGEASVIANCSTRLCGYLTALCTSTLRQEDETFYI